MRSLLKTDSFQSHHHCYTTVALPKLVFTIGFVMVASNVLNLASGFDLPILRNHVNLTTEVKDIVASVVNIILNCVVIFIFILITFYVYKMEPSARNESNDGVEATNNVANTAMPEISTINYSNSKETTTIAAITTDQRSTTSSNYQDNSYCDSLLYNFTYWFITLTILFVIILSLIGIASCAYNRYRKARMKSSSSRVFDTQTAFQVES